YNVAQRINNEQTEGLSAEERSQLSNLYTALMRKGQGIAIKADKDTPFTTVQMVFDNLQTMKLNKFSLMTALKSENEPTQ
ncbi:MAG: biopolymer transporter ExbD, partial [Muribaculaceae bacterium]|nr:biopolymer transporter ExbD [Muribaculaceae bacterium]